VTRLALDIRDLYAVAAFGGRGTRGTRLLMLPGACASRPPVWGAGRYADAAADEGVGGVHRYVRHRVATSAREGDTLSQLENVEFASALAKSLTEDHDSSASAGVVLAVPGAGDGATHVARVIEAACQAACPGRVGVIDERIASAIACGHAARTVLVLSAGPGGVQAALVACGPGRDARAEVVDGRSHADDRWDQRWARFSGDEPQALGGRRLAADDAGAWPPGRSLLQWSTLGWLRQLAGPAAQPAVSRTTWDGERLRAMVATVTDATRAAAGLVSSIIDVADDLLRAAGPGRVDQVALADAVCLLPGLQARACRDVPALARARWHADPFLAAKGALAATDDVSWLEGGPPPRIQDGRLLVDVGLRTFDPSTGASNVRVMLAAGSRVPCRQSVKLWRGRVGQRRLVLDMVASDGGAGTVEPIGTAELPVPAGLDMSMAVPVTVQCDAAGAVRCGVEGDASAGGEPPMLVGAIVEPRHVFHAHARHFLRRATLLSTPPYEFQEQ
jgi:hypothetical protein